jgi:hypothetical protein
MCCRAWDYAAEISIPKDFDAIRFSKMAAVATSEDDAAAAAADEEEDEDASEAEEARSAAADDGSEQVRKWTCTVLRLRANLQHWRLQGCRMGRQEGGGEEAYSNESNDSNHRVGVLMLQTVMLTTQCGDHG